MGKKVIQSLDNDLKGYGAIPVNDFVGLSGDVQGLTTQMAEKTSQLNSKEINVLYPPPPLVAAKGDGVTDDTAAIQAILNYAATLVQLGLKPTIFFPQGIYIVSNGVLSGFTSSGIIAGITFLGINQYSSVLYLKTAGATSWLYDNGSSSKLENVLFEKLGFTSDDVNNGNAFKITSSGNEKQFSFRNCSFGNWVNNRVGKDTTAGGLYGILDTEGTGNADLMKFVDCKFFCNGYVVNNNNPQSVAIEFYGCDGVINGDLFRFGNTPGGSMKVFGGAIDLYANPSNTPSYLVNMTGTGSHGIGNGDICFFGTRFEFHGTNKGIVNAQNLTADFTSVHFQGCNLAGSIDNTQTMVIITARKVVSFRDCTLNEKILFQFVGTPSTTSSPENSGLILIENSQVGGSQATPLFQRFTTAGMGRVIARNNRTNGSKAYGSTNVMDFDIGWQTAQPRDPNVHKKVAVIIPSTQNFPWVNNQTVWTVSLPAGAMITRVYINKPAQGTATANYQLYVGLGDKSVTWGSSTLQAQNLQHIIDVSPMYTIGSVTTVGLWVDAINGGSSATQTGLGFIEYI